MKRITLARRDSVAVDTLWLLQYWLRSKIDSAIAANPAAADSLFGRRPHDWNASQRWRDTLAAAETAIPWSFQEMDTTLAWWALTLTANEWTNGPAGSPNYTDRVMRFGYNMERDDLSEPSIGQQYESKYYNSKWMMEWHLATVGIDGTNHRPLSATFDRYRGHMLELTVESRVTGFRGDGHGEPWLYLDADDDSTSPGVGSVKLLNGSTLQAADPNVSIVNASNNSTIQNVISTGGNTQLYFGSSGWTDLNLQAGTKTFTLNYAGIISQNIFVATDASDTTGVLGFNEYGWLRKRWLVTIGQVNARVSAGLDSAFTQTGGRRLNVANLSHGSNGQYLVMFGGAPSWVTPSWATAGSIADSIRELLDGTRKFHHSRIDFTGYSSGLSADSVRRLGRQYIAPMAQMTFWNTSDTAALRFFHADAAGGVNTGPGSSALLFHAPYPLVIDRMVITHSRDTSTTARRRDTLVTFTLRDSIPQGAAVYVYYAGSAVSTVYNGSGLQIVGMGYKALNDLNTFYFVGQKIQVPLIVPNMLMSRRGVRDQDWLSCTVSFIEKVPGLIY
ncbi:MAG: hypothetical protein HY962_07165 [Ignavibacteriae bacterium]|nr:hypothetical protein [Ignavibacteriota bacterium]